jgi:hypothetical protein
MEEAVRKMTSLAASRVGLPVSSALFVGHPWARRIPEWPHRFALGSWKSSRQTGSEAGFCDNCDLNASQFLLLAAAVQCQAHQILEPAFRARYFGKGALSK